MKLIPLFKVRGLDTIHSTMRLCFACIICDLSNLLSDRSHFLSVLFARKHCGMPVRKPPDRETNLFQHGSLVRHFTVITAKRHVKIHL